MNLLTNIFTEFFDEHRYYDSYGRCYVEYITEKEIGYTGKVCFFHFSETGERKNSYMNIEILKFIRVFYSLWYTELYTLMKYAIHKDIVMTFNSFSETSFLLKFQNTDIKMRSLISDFILKMTWYRVPFSQSKDLKFYELIFSFDNTALKLDSFKYYTELYNHDATSDLELGYIEKDNIFMVLFVEEIFFWKEGRKEEGYLYKFTTPVSFQSSPYLKKHFWEDMKKYFSLDKTFLAFVEKRNNSQNDILYFTDDFAIPA